MMSLLYESKISWNQGSKSDSAGFVSDENKQKCIFFLRFCGRAGVVFKGFSNTGCKSDLPRWDTSEGAPQLPPPSAPFHLITQRILRWAKLSTFLINQRAAGWLPSTLFCLQTSVQSLRLPAQKRCINETLIYDPRCRKTHQHLGLLQAGLL